MTLLPLALLIGCNPQDAEVTADYAVYLAAASSENLNRLSRTGTDVSTLGMTPIDCRYLGDLDDEAIAATRLAGVDYAAECCDGGSGEGCNQIEPQWFDWVNDYAYYLKEGKVEPWRTEAVLTTEGDLQLTVHLDVGEFGDFRFGWVIDPTFQPTECVDGESGAEEQEIDGNWLENWSANEEKGTLWHLNAGGYQVNPSNGGTVWSFEQEWMAGYTFARFGDEEFYGHSTDYQDPYVSNESPYGRPFYLGTYTRDYSAPALPGGPGWGATPAESQANLDEWAAEVDEFFNADSPEMDDLATIGKSSFPFKMKIENNSWRELDDRASGLDGWLGVSPSWVQIDNPDAIKVHPDQPVTGSFQVYLEGLSAASKVLVGGTFVINEIEEDVWGYEYGTLEGVKREENNTPACGDERMTEEVPVEE